MPESAVSLVFQMFLSSETKRGHGVGPCHHKPCSFVYRCKIRRPVTPSYKEVIIDEAHHVEEVVSDHFGVQTDYFVFVRLLERMGTKEDNGLVQKLYELTETTEVPGLEESLDKIAMKAPDLKMELDDLFRTLRDYVLEAKKAA